MKYAAAVSVLVLLGFFSRAAGEVRIPLGSLTGNDAAAKRVMRSLSQNDQEVLRRRMQAIYEQGIRKGARGGDIGPAPSAPAAPPRTVPGSVPRGVPVVAKITAERPAEFVKFVSQKSGNGVYTMNFIVNNHYKKAVSVVVNGSRVTLRPREKKFLSRNSPYSSTRAPMRMQSPVFVN